MVFFPRCCHGTRPKNGEYVFPFSFLLFNKHVKFPFLPVFIPPCYLSFQFFALWPSFLLCRLLFLSASYFYFSFIFILSNFDQLKQKLSNKINFPTSSVVCFLQFFFFSLFLQWFPSNQIFSFYSFSFSSSFFFPIGFDSVFCILPV